MDSLEQKLRAASAFMPAGLVDEVIETFRRMRADIDNLQDRIGRLESEGENHGEQ